MLKFARIKETCLYTSDLEGCRDFYVGKLGLELHAYEPGRYVFFIAGDSMLLCFNPESTRVQGMLPPHWGSGRYHFAFEAQEGEYDAWKSKIQQEGIAIEHEQTWGNGTKSLYFEDPDGNCVEILQWRMWELPG